MSDAPCPYVRGTREGTRWCALAADDKLREAARMALEALGAMQMEAAARSCGLRICDEAIAALREALGG